LTDKSISSAVCLISEIAFVFSVIFPDKSPIDELISVIEFVFFSTVALI